MTTNKTGVLSDYLDVLNGIKSLSIWQERRALLFCQEDRAILCRECDIPIHQANEHTKKHNRFLLTGVKISASPSTYPRASNPNSVAGLYRAKTRPKSVSGEVPSSASSEVFESSPLTTTSNYYYRLEENYQQASDSGSGSGGTGAGSISEYLMETLPGWRVEDLLEHPSCVSYEDNTISTNNNNNNNESYRVYDGSSQYHHQGFWEQKPFSWTLYLFWLGVEVWNHETNPTYLFTFFSRFFLNKNSFVFVNKSLDLDCQF